MEMIKNLRTLVIALITSNLNNYPTRVPILFNQKEGRIVMDQIRTIDKSRIINVVGTLNFIEIYKFKSVNE